MPILILALLALVAGPSSAQDSKLEMEITTADEDFNKAVAAKDRVRFLSFIDEAATFVSGAAEMRGKDAIMKGWDAFFQTDGPSLEWHPTGAQVLVGGDVGHTVGRWVRNTRGPDGKTIQTTGQYLTVWKKQADGSWKVVYDIGSTAP